MKKTRLPRIIFDYQHSHNLVNSWLKDVKTIFSIVNCSDVFENNLPIVNLKSFINYAREKLMQVHASTWNTEVANKPKLYMLAQYKKHYITEKYCSLNLKRSHRSLIAKLRLGILPIRIETGRYNGLYRKDRLCLVCKDGNVEDKCHVMFQCKAHIEAREILFNEACKIHSQFLNLTEIQKILLNFSPVTCI